MIFNENLVFFNGLYEQPWARLSPYIFGICIGYVLRKIDRKLQISLTLMICGTQIFWKIQFNNTFPIVGIEISIILLILLSFLLLFSFIQFCLGWIACLFLVIALIFSKTFIQLPSTSTNALFSMLMHIIWSAIVLWIIIASISKHRGKYCF